MVQFKYSIQCVFRFKKLPGVGEFAVKYGVCRVFECLRLAQCVYMCSSQTDISCKFAYDQLQYSVSELRVVISYGS